jgi:N-acetyl-alpha-D-muramate 1-phosphate uridylyltransferase
MILAAGLGTRLRPLTDRTPKALVPIAGVSMLERVAQRMIEAGVDRLIVNVHHHAHQVLRLLDERDGFGVDVRISEEPDAPLETGGGLMHARQHFRLDAPFFLHNVDVVSAVPLDAMYAAHQQSGPLVTLAVSDRPASRRLAFDDYGLRGRLDARSGVAEWVREARGSTRDFGFSGIHVISPSFFDLVEEQGVFSIMTPYLRLAGAGHAIRPFDIGDALWLEMGDPDRLEQARRLLERPDMTGAV